MTLKIIYVLVYLYNEIENSNGKCVKETANRPKSRQTYNILFIQNHFMFMQKNLKLKVCELVKMWYQGEYDSN